MLGRICKFISILIGVLRKFFRFLELNKTATFNFY
jgi:hypothetical protein